MKATFFPYNYNRFFAGDCLPFRSVFTRAHHSFIQLSCDTHFQFEFMKLEVSLNTDINTAVTERSVELESDVMMITTMGDKKVGKDRFMS